MEVTMNNISSKKYIEVALDPEGLVEETEDKSPPVALVSFSRKLDMDDQPSTAAVTVHHEVALQSPPAESFAQCACAADGVADDTFVAGGKLANDPSRWSRDGNANGSHSGGKENTVLKSRLIIDPILIDSFENDYSQTSDDDDDDVLDTENDDLAIAGECFKSGTRFLTPPEVAVNSEEDITRPTVSWVAERRHINNYAVNLPQTAPSATFIYPPSQTATNQITPAATPHPFTHPNSTSVRQASTSEALMTSQTLMSSHGDQLENIT